MSLPEEPQPSRPRLRLSIGAAVTLGLVVLSAAVGWGILRGQTAPTDVIPLDVPTSVSSAELYVHVLGDVSQPGLYVLDPGARLVDALAAAGGTLDTADLRAVNLARPLSDGEQVVVPAQGEGGEQGPAGASGDGVIDLNSADQTALESLPRIGPALAQRIIAWREQNGRFRSVDDLLAVSGIGEKLLSGLRDLVRV
ncbi:MAG: helix-hairpin-helix domain-containing protein [Microbacterium sp.]